MQVGDASGDVTWLVDSMVKTLRDTTRLATSAGRRVAEDLLTEMPTLSEGVRRCPSGTDVEVPWSPKATFMDSETCLLALDPWLFM